MLKPVILASLFLLTPLTAQAQENFTIKLKKEGKGTTTQETKSTSMSQNIKVNDNAGNTVNEVKKAINLSAEYSSEIVEKPDPKKKATVVKRTYQKATVEVDGQKKALPYQGKTVVIELKNDKFSFRYDGGDAIKGDDADWLDKEFNKEASDDFDFEDQLVPDKAVAEGGTWSIPMAVITKQLAKSGEFVFDGDKATGSGKLLKAYKKDGAQFGDLTIKLEIPVKAIKEMGQAINLQAGSTLVMEGAITTCIDGTLLDGNGKISWHLTGVALVPPEMPQVRVNISIRDAVDAATKESIKK